MKKQIKNKLVSPLCRPKSYCGNSAVRSSYLGYAVAAVFLPRYGFWTARPRTNFEEFLHVIYRPFNSKNIYNYAYRNFGKIGVRASVAIKT